MKFTNLLNKFKEGAYMQIHVVQPGQSLYGIAQAYNTTLTVLADANGLNLQDALVVGQALVIPIVGRFYWVQPGDTLISISQKVGVDYQRLAEVNQLNINQPLNIGLRLYIPPAPKREGEFNAYIEPRGTEVKPVLEKSARTHAPYLTYLAPFSFQIQRDGSLKEPLLNNFPQIAQANKVTLMMVLTNLEQDQFSDELGRIILNNKEVQENLITNILTTAEKYNFRDIHFDMEYLRPADKNAYNQFLRKVKNRLPEGYLLSTALAPKTSAEQKGEWYEAHDYKTHGEIVDFVVVMSYEWGYSGGPPMPVSPIGPVREVLEYAVSEMPSSKVMMGQNLYGYDWTLPFVTGGEYAKALSPQAAIELARNQNVPIQYDLEAQAPHFNYVDNEGKEHKVWFEDARSIQAKFDLVKELGLRGVSYWKLGLPFPQNWLLIQDNFEVVKK